MKWTDIAFCICIMNLAFMCCVLKRMSHRINSPVGTILILLLFIYPIINLWFDQSEIVETKPALLRPPVPRPITRRRLYSYDKDPIIHISAPSPPKTLTDWPLRPNTNTTWKGCEPKKNIVYLKTHKTASSTLQNIVYRWGERHNLTFALPASGVEINYPLTRKQLVPSPSGTYNIFANHARFEPKAFQDIMSPDSVYITILRTPQKQFESYYNYFHCQALRVYGARLHTFLRYPQRYLDYAWYTKLRNSKCVISVQNPQLYDLGFNSVQRGETSPAKHSSLGEWIDVLTNTFHLVLIADYFMESLVVLKDTMCWDTDDVVVLDVNRRLSSTTPAPNDQREQATELHGLIEHWNAGDVALYQHFNRTLWKRLDLIGRDAVSHEILAIQKRTYELVNRCLDNIEWISDTVYRTKTAYQTPLKNIVEGYTLRREMRNDPLCQRIVLTAPNYLDFLRRKTETI